MYEKYLDLSMAGASTIKPDDVRSILRSFIIQFHDYEAPCRFRNVPDRMSYERLDRPCRKWDMQLRRLNYFVVDSGLMFAMSALKIPHTVFEMYHSQRLLGSIISKYLDRLDNRSYSLPSLDRSEQRLVLWAVGVAGTMYRANGRRGEAMSLLEIVIHLVEQHLDLQDAVIWFFYNEMLIELAHCCAEDGHWDEARQLLNKLLKQPSNFEEYIANMRRTRFWFPVTLSKRRLRNRREEALQLVGQLENGHTDTQEHHTRFQEGSCLQGTSEWGPFLTDCIEWDKI